MNHDQGMALIEANFKGSQKIRVYKWTLLLSNIFLFENQLGK